ncbi:MULTISPECIES: response regulator [Roseobacteraceae]|uniref:Transcriptional activator protein CzcR n=1 Tax=Pseudosulfitobacter pseudonitzschiae TaxID=1402135 RepID=A0A221K6L2_9RHOB|nr:MULTISPECIES: response regulator [Roseobacteraceae]ASM74520.1 transcriptional activator protein CzcR [Pseudosulfitobacter pseudonitzschiae]
MTHETQPALILVVEDEDALRRDLVEELNDAGYRTLAASDGQGALDLLNNNTPDLLLCDITMPGLDGYGVLSALRSQRPELSMTPFVFLTALSEPREVVQGKLLGADDYLVKPVDYDLMLATVGARLRQVDRIRNRHDDELSTLRTALGGLSGDGVEQALDLMSLGIVLVDAQGRPVHINRAAHEMAAAIDFIRFDTASVHAIDPLSDRELQQAIAGTLQAAQAGAEKVVGVLLHGGQDAPNVSALACALPNRNDVGPAQPCVALFLASPNRRRVSEAVLIDLYDLTPTEARIAGALASSARKADVAAELGVSQTTIAFHMRNLFEKTGTHRQADLIALILSGPMMIKSE